MMRRATPCSGQQSLSWLQARLINSPQEARRGPRRSHASLAATFRHRRSFRLSGSTLKVCWRIVRRSLIGCP